MWDLNQSIAFFPPRVIQHRNKHNHLADMRAEDDLYFKSFALVRFLRSWSSAGATLQERYEDLIIALFERDFIGAEDVALAQQWLVALERVGYDFPLIT